MGRHSLLEYLGCREEDLTEEKLGKVGWRKSSNRNRMLQFSDKRGRVHWYKGGRVLLYLRKPVILAKAKELFSRAFSWFDGKALTRYLDVPLHEEMRHWVFDVGKPVPRFEIRKFKPSHGIHIYSDKSHPNAVEVEETVPFWITEFRETAQNFGKTVAQFGVEIKQHMKLIREWQKEARDRREKSLIKFFRKKMSKTADLINGVLKKFLNYRRTHTKNE